MNQGPQLSNALFRFNLLLLLGTAAWGVFRIWGWWSGGGDAGFLSALLTYLGEILCGYLVICLILALRYISCTAELFYHHGFTWIYRLPRLWEISQRRTSVMLGDYGARRRRPYWMAIPGYAVIGVSLLQLGSRHSSWLLTLLGLHFIFCLIPVQWVINGMLPRVLLLGTSTPQTAAMIVPIMRELGTQRILHMLQPSASGKEGKTTALSGLSRRVRPEFANDWLTTVKDLGEESESILVDARQCSDAVLQELDAMRHKRFAQKTVVLVGDSDAIASEEDFASVVRTQEAALESLKKILRDRVWAQLKDAENV